jgi:histidine kinase
MHPAEPSLTDDSPPGIRWRKEGHRMLRHCAMTAVFCLVVGCALALGKEQPLAPQLAYSFATGMASWLFIDVARIALDGEGTGWPHGGRGIVTMIAGIGFGYIVGNLIGDAYMGYPFGSSLWPAPRRLTSALLVTVFAGTAASYFFYSRGRSKYLLGRIAMVQRDAAEAQLKLLETQLEPHMLFNTLANLRVLIAADPQRAQAMLDHLIDYLRATLGGSRAVRHPVATDFDRLRDYLELMAVRMGARLRYQLDLPDDLRSAAIPPLLLQPLVENSIRHGLEPKVEGGTVTVRASRTSTGAGAMLRIEACTGAAENRLRTRECS